MSFPFLQPYAGLSNSLQTAQAGGAGGPSVGGWVELGRTTLGSAGDTISVSSLPNKRYFWCQVFTKATGGTIQQRMRFNNDSGSNYAERYSQDGGTDGTITSDGELLLSAAPSTPAFTNMFITNNQSNEKLVLGHNVNQGGAGAANDPERYELAHKWANTSNQITQIDAINTGSGNFDTGSELVVLGWDPADTHTTNFWEELADINATGSESSFDTGTFTAKKYLWIQFYWKATFTGAYTNMRVGNTTLDTGSNYAWRWSNNGGADSTGVSQSDGWYPVTGQGNDNATDYYVFGNMFMVNNASNEKLGICHTNRWDGAGAGNANARSEVTVKWANTTNQIDIVGLERAGGSASGNFDSVSQIKVWGSD